MDREREETIAVTLHLHPHLARYRPRTGVSSDQSVEVPTGTTVGELLTRTCGLPAKLQVFIALNGRRASPEDPLHDGDRVRIFMQLSGG